jgi:predicted amidophosphoribosyltransferase
MGLLKVLLSTCKKRVNFWASAVIDLFFPPLCRLCAEPAKTLLCSECFDLLALTDIDSRCRHCFAPLESPSGLCRQCARSPRLSAPRAYLFEPSAPARRLQSIMTRDEEEPLRRAVASLLIVLWSRLNWPLFDRICLVRPMRHRRALQDIGEELSRMLDRPLTDEFSRSWVSPFTWRLKRRGEDLLENQSILLVDLASSPDDLRQALNELWPALAGKIYILSVFGHDC